MNHLLNLLHNLLYKINYPIGISKVCGIDTTSVPPIFSMIILYSFPLYKNYTFFMFSKIYKLISLARYINYKIIFKFNNYIISFILSKTENIFL